ELALRHELAAVAHQQLEDLPLRRGEADLAVGPGHGLGQQVDAEVRRAYRRRVEGLVGPSQRGAQPGEELVHAERLGHVVVGAGVEGGDLHRLGPPRRQHDDRDRRPAAQPLRHLDAVDAGQPEVEDDRVWLVAGRERERFLPRRGERHVVAAGAQPDVERPAHRRLVVDDEDEAHPAPPNRNSIVVPPPGVSSMVSSPPSASTNPRATASPSPIPAPVCLSPRRWKGRKTFSRWSRGIPGPRSTTRSSTAPPMDAPSTRTGASGGDQAMALSTTLAMARSRRAASVCTCGRFSGTSTTTWRARSPRLATARATTSSSPTSWRTSSSAPLCSRLMSSRL